jgi:hypothetical protein
VLFLRALTLTVLLPAPAVAAEAPETTLDIVATAVRERGHACARPQTVERDPVTSLPDRPAFIVRCDTRRFQVIFEGDTGARVIPLD